MEIRIERREEYSSRRLAAEMLAAAAKTDPENIRFYQGKNGKPLSDLPYFFNCSHSGEYVACAVSRREIGVELESLPQEEWDRAFLRLWTMKESWIKCRSGVVWEYKQCNFVEENGVLSVKPKGYNFTFPATPEGYVLTVCEKE